MQFEALKVFCDIARLRSFSQAAEANGISQSAASQIVHALEVRLGGALIDRSMRPLRLTPLGQAYYEGCRQLVDAYLHLEGTLRRDSPPLAATVLVAAISSVGHTDMEQYQERFRQIQPQALARLEYLNPDEVYERVKVGGVDFGLVSFPRKGRELHFLPWREEGMILACAPGHALAAQGCVCPADVADCEYIAFKPHLEIRRQIDQFWRAQKVKLKFKAELDSVAEIKQAVADGLGVALLPEPTFRRDVNSGTLVARPLQGVRFLRPMGIIYRKHHTLSSFAMRFIELLREDSPDTFTDFGARRRAGSASSQRKG